MLIPAFSMLIKQGVACAVEGDIKVSMAMSIPANVIALTYILPLNDRDFSRALWQSATECPAVFPEKEAHVSSHLATL